MAGNMNTNIFLKEVQVKGIGRKKKTPKARLIPQEEEVLRSTSTERLSTLRKRRLRDEKTDDVEIGIHSSKRFQVTNSAHAAVQNSDQTVEAGNQPRQTQ